MRRVKQSKPPPIFTYKWKRHNYISKILFFKTNTQADILCVSRFFIFLYLKNLFFRFFVWNVATPNKSCFTYVRDTPLYFHLNKDDNILKSWARSVIRPMSDRIGRNRILSGSQKNILIQNYRTIKNVIVDLTYSQKLFIWNFREMIIE